MTPTDDVLTELETKAKAALEFLPEEVRDYPWKVRTAQRNVTLTGLEVASAPLDFILVPGTRVLDGTIAEHMAAADPHAVLALVAEVRRLRTLNESLTQNHDAGHEEAKRDAFRARKTCP